MEVRAVAFPLESLFYRGLFSWKNAAQARIVVDVAVITHWIA